MERRKREPIIPPAEVFGLEAVLNVLGAPSSPKGPGPVACCQAQCLGHSKPFPLLTPVFCGPIVFHQPDGVLSVRTCPLSSISLDKSPQLLNVTKIWTTLSASDTSLISVVHYSLF